MLKNIGFEEKQIFFNLYVPNGENYTQIDVLVVCKIGIIVFEVKDYNSAIFGGIDEKYWHHTYISYDTYQMYNPIIQNANHISCLKKHFSGFNMLNVVVFFGNCRLRHTRFLSSKCCVIYADQLNDCINYLYYHNKQNNNKMKTEYLNLLNKFMENGNNVDIQKQHLNNTKKYKQQEG